MASEKIGKERQREVGCSVLFCEAEWCCRKRKTSCALRKYFLSETIRHKKNRDTLSMILGAESAIKYAKKHFFWREHEAKRKKK